MTRIRLAVVFTSLTLAIPIIAQMRQEKVDLDAVYRIKDQVVEIVRIYHGAQDSS